MPAGSAPGERRGGRVKGSKNHATVARQAKVAADGVTPLEVMLDGMRFHHTVAVDALKEPEPDRKAIAAALKEAKEFARDAAPYVHPKLASTELTGKNGAPIEMSVSDHDRARALAAFVAKLKAKG